MELTFEVKQYIRHHVSCREEVFVYYRIEPTNREEYETGDQVDLEPNKSGSAMFYDAEANKLYNSYDEMVEDITKKIG